MYYDQLSGVVVGVNRCRLDGDDYVCDKADVLVDERGKVCAGKKSMRVILMVPTAASSSTSNTRSIRNTSSKSSSSGSATYSAAGSSGGSNQGNNMNLNEMLENATEMGQEFVNSTLIPLVNNLTEAIQNAMGNAGINTNNGPAANSSDVLVYGFMFAFSAIILKVVISMMLGFSFFLLPVGIILFCTCPSEREFDAKKELKRVLRGAHLPDDHPEKPKGWLEKTAAKITASVTAELVTAAGYEVSMTNYGGMAIFACVEVPTSNVKLYYLGCLNRWTYILQRPINIED